MADQFVDRGARNGSIDDWGMDFRRGDGALVSVGVLWAGGSGAGCFRGELLSRGVAAAQGWQLEHGYAGGAGLDHRICVQRVGVVQRGGWPYLFHGSRFDYY